MSEPIVHGIDPLKLAKYFVKVCRRGHNHEPHPTKIEGLKLVDKTKARVVYNGGQVWDKYNMPVGHWLQAMLEENNVVKSSVKEKWSQFVYIDEIETDSDNNIIRIRYHIKKLYDFLDKTDPTRSIWTR